MSRHTEAARGRPCIRCGADPSIDASTTVPAHYSRDLAHKLGKGTGIRAHDLALAWLCVDCHDYFDERNQPQQRGLDPREKELERVWKSLEFAILCLQTVIVRYEEGQLGK